MRAGGQISHWIIGAAIAAAATGAVLAIAGIETPARLPLTLLFVVAAPALAVATLLGGIDAIGKVVIAGSAAVVIDMAIAETMIATGTWSARLGVTLVALVSVVIAALRPLAGRWSAKRAARPPGTAVSGQSQR